MHASKIKEIQLQKTRSLHYQQFSCNPTKQEGMQKRK